MRRITIQVSSTQAKQGTLHTAFRSAPARQGGRSKSGTTGQRLFRLPGDKLRYVQSLQGKVADIKVKGSEANEDVSVGFASLAVVPIQG